MNTGENVAPWFRRLAVITAVMVYLLMVMGGIVRVTGSGLGCPDWPTCYGHLIPPLELHSIIEYAHRTIAALTGGFIVATVAAAWLRFRQHPWIVWPATAVIGLLTLQIPLGGLVVATELESLLVAFHLGMAMLIFASALIVAIAARRAQARLRADLTGRDRLLLGSALVAFFVMLTTGAIVVGSNASLACTGWPLCSGGLLPPPGASPLAAIHLLHRYTVAAVTILAAVVIGWVLRRGAVHGVSKAWGIVLGVLFAAQIAVGAVQVWLLMPAFWRGLHLATASAIWSVIVIIAVQASLIAAAAQPVMAAGTTLNAQPISGD